VPSVQSQATGHATKDVNGDIARAWPRLVVLWGLLGVSATLFLFTAAMLGRGIDLTDEGSYLNTIARPGLYPTNPSQFGVLLHPFLVFSNYDIVLLRALNYFAMVGFTAVLVARVLMATGLREALTKLERVAIGASFSISALLYYCLWVPTPSYNSVNLIGGLLVAIAVIGAREMQGRSIPVPSIILAGLGLALCALSKPTTGATLALLLVLSPWNSPRQMSWFILGAGAVSAALCAALLLLWLGPPHVIMEDYSAGAARVQSVLSGDSTFGGLFWWSVPFPREYLHIAIVSVLTIAMYALSMRTARGTRTRYLSEALALAGIFSACIWTQIRNDWWNHPVHWTPLVCALVLAICYALENRPRIDRHLARLSIVTLLIPLAVGFGSNTGLLRAAGQAAPIWAVGSILLVATVTRGPFLKAAVLRLAVVTVAATSVVIAMAEYYPWRQVAPLWSQTNWMSAHGRERALRVDAVSAEYFTRLTTAADAAGFTDGTPVIDLTGTSPTTIYVLGGDAIGLPYLGRALIENALRGVPRDRLARAWILTSPKGADASSPTVLGLHGLNFPADYVEVTRAMPGPPIGEQILWRPKSTVE
jgi:hypothetical protein